MQNNNSVFIHIIFASILHWLRKQNAKAGKNARKPVVRKPGGNPPEPEEPPVKTKSPLITDDSPPGHRIRWHF